MALQEGPAALLRRGHSYASHLEKAGVQLPNEGTDGAALARGPPALQKHENGQLGLSDALLKSGQVQPPGFQAFFALPGAGPIRRRVPVVEHNIDLLCPTGNLVLVYT